jgi:hypothetical protein
MSEIQGSSCYAYFVFRPVLLENSLIRLFVHEHTMARCKLRVVGSLWAPSFHGQLEACIDRKYFLILPPVYWLARVVWGMNCSY